MRIALALLAVGWIAGCSKPESDLNPSISHEVIAEIPPPELAAETFAAVLKEHFLWDTPSDLDSIRLSSTLEKDVILGNLAHLPKLEKITFREVPLSKTDLTKLAPFRNVTQIELAGYDHVSTDLLSSIPSVTQLEFSQCEFVPWERIHDTCGQKLQHLEVSRSPIDGDGIASLSAIATLESIGFYDSRHIDETALSSLSKLKSLNSLTVVNCDEVQGAFLSEIQGRLELDEFTFTGSLAPAEAIHLGKISSLRRIQVNSEQELPVEWFRSISRGCQQLQSLVLHYQALDKEKIDYISSLPLLKELQACSNGQVPDFSFGGPSVQADVGSLVSISRLENLETLHLSRGYRLGASDGEAIASLPKLKELVLWHVHLEPGSLADLGRLENLGSLDIYNGASLSTADAKAIGALPNLETLKLRECRKGAGADFSHLKNLKKLRTLDLSGIHGLSDGDMSMAQGMVSLEKLTLERNSGVSDAGIAKWHQATNLRELWIQKLNMDGSGFIGWPSSHGIESIYIEGTSIDDDGLKALSRLQNVQSLDIRLQTLLGWDIRVDLCLRQNPFVTVPPPLWELRYHAREYEQAGSS
ncbi:hypothetical protein [Aeoliella sp.]|uniref:hypothetical protein n=1 Tax=Aeoliella sp. TaxID=2795800 RepID=UPI003CCBCA41